MPDATPSVDSLLASLLNQFGKKPKAERKSSAGKKPVKPGVPLSQPAAFNLARTGYREWQAIARIIQIQPQVCACCGETTHAVKGEFYALENGHAHSVWLRPEGYGIEAQHDLPIQYRDLPPQTVTACAACRLPQVDEAILAQVAASRQLTFPF